MKETKWISEFEYVTFKQSLRSVLIKTICGLCFGLIIGIYGIFTEEDFGVLEAVMSILMFTGMPYAWTVLPFASYGCMGLFIRFIVSLLLGWIITPIVLTYNFIQMKRYEKNVQIFVQKEEREREEDIQRENSNTDRIVEAIEKLNTKIDNM